MITDSNSNEMKNLQIYWQIKKKFKMRINNNNHYKEKKTSNNIKLMNIKKKITK